MSRRSEAKRRKREELREFFKSVGTEPRSPGLSQPDPMRCYSATCADCGRVYISAIKPIAPNVRRGRRRVYVCGRCR